MPNNCENDPQREAEIALKLHNGDKRRAQEWLRRAILFNASSQNTGPGTSRTTITKYNKILQEAIELLV